jgi:hypothetical protein
MVVHHHDGGCARNHRAPEHLPKSISRYTLRNVSGVLTTRDQNAIEAVKSMDSAAFKPVISDSPCSFFLYYLDAEA